MRNIDNQIQGYYKDSKENLYAKYNDKLYAVSSRKSFCLNDIFCDLRDEHIKIVESERDLVDMSFIAPELYIILEEVKEN